MIALSHKSQLTYGINLRVTLVWSFKFEDLVTYLKHVDWKYLNRNTGDILTGIDNMHFLFFFLIHFSWTCFWFITVYIHFTNIRITLVCLAVRAACISWPHIQVIAFHSKFLRHKEFIILHQYNAVYQFYKKKPSRQYQNILTNCWEKYAFKLFFFIDTYHFNIKSYCMYH